MSLMNLEKHLLARRALTLVGFLLVGVAGFVLLQYSSTSPKRRPPSTRGRPVRVLAAATIDAVPRAVGYGVVTAQREWQAVAQVSGAIVEMDENVEVGRVVDEGTRLFKIDPGSLELERNRTKATVQAARAQVDELKAKEESAKRTLDVEKRSLALVQKDYERIQALYERGLTSSAELEAAERNLLTAEKAVRQLENTIRELPASRKVLEAQLAQQKTGEEGATMDLARTEVIAPFTMRIQQVNSSLHQAVNSGQVVLVGGGTDVMEVPAQLPVGAIGPLLGRRASASAVSENATAAGGDGRDLTAAAGAGMSESAPEKEGEPVPIQNPTEAGVPPKESASSGTQARPRRSRAAAIKAIVRLKSQGIERTWEGRFRRFEGIDPTTRAMGVVVEIPQPRQRGGPPLLPGMYVEVELRGAERADCLAVPRTALHGDVVYVVGKDERLTLRPIETDLLQEQFACISKGLENGEQVVLTELAPAVEGMQLIPRPDETASAWLSSVARGETSKP